MIDAREQLTGYAQTLEDALKSYLPDCPYPEAGVVDAMAYSLLGGGKRIRGALVLAFYHLFQKDIRPALPYAGALEMIHAYSLIHDDLPCMDDDDMRRGKPSCHVKFGEATALLAGDGLLTLAFETMTNPAYTKFFNPDAVIGAVRCLSNAAGCGGMIGGQVIDLDQEGKPGNRDLMHRTYAKKTGALIVASGQIGCILSGADDGTVNKSTAYCQSIGLAFQIMDDILDVTGDESDLGKPIGSDQQNLKCTFVSEYGLEAAWEEVNRLNQKAKEALTSIEGDTCFLEGLVDLLAARRN